MFDHGREERLQATAYLIDPATLNTVARAQDWGKTASRAIKDCEEMIARLQEYHQLLYKRVQEIAAAPYHTEITLTRHKGYYDKRVTYTLQYWQVYDIPGIDRVEGERTIYPGTDRRKAIADYKAAVAAHPGVICSMDIEKGRWER